MQMTALNTLVQGDINPRACHSSQSMPPWSRTLEFLALEVELMLNAAFKTQFPQESAECSLLI